MITQDAGHSALTLALLPCNLERQSPESICSNGKRWTDGAVEVETVHLYETGEERERETENAAAEVGTQKCLLFMVLGV